MVSSCSGEMTPSVSWWKTTSFQIWLRSSGGRLSRVGVLSEAMVETKVENLCGEAVSRKISAVKFEDKVDAWRAAH